MSGSVVICVVGVLGFVVFYLMFCGCGLHAPCCSFVEDTRGVLVRVAYLQVGLASMRT